MPHAIYISAFVACPWPGCGLPIEMIDFQLELYADAAFYSRVMRDWGAPGFGLIGSCPKCGNFVLYGLNEKRQIIEAQSLGLPVLPDDWHQHAYIA